MRGEDVTHASGTTAEFDISAPLFPVFDMPKAHVTMLNDRTRTERYIQALREVVRPGMVVADIGTGTGVFAVAAAKAGARRVYAIEAGGIGDTAQRLFEGNGLADRIQLVRARSTVVELPEPVDVFVSETIGREPLEQRVLEIFLDARARLLKPGGCFVPYALGIHAMPVSIPADDLDRMDFTTASVERWGAWYGVDFRPLLETRLPRVAFKDPSAVARWPRVADPVLVAQVDFATLSEPVVDSSVVCKAVHSATVNGVVVSFELQLSKGISFTTHPDEASDDNSWRHAVFLPPPVALEAGEEMVVGYRYRMPGLPCGAWLAPRERAAPRSAPAD